MGDNPEAKIFVGGLNHVTTANSLRTYFSRYGEVVATNIVFDRMTQKSRGFGFVQFTSPGVVLNVMSMPHTIDGKIVDLKPAQKGAGNNSNNTRLKMKVIPDYNPVFQKKVEEERNKNARKVFVGGLKLSTTPNAIVDYFQRFGPVDECIITKNKQTGRSRGFGFVTFQLSETIDEVLKHRHAIEGKGVEIKRAENRGGKVPIIPEKKQDRNRNSGPGGPRGEKGGFGGSGYGLIYGAFDFHMKMQQQLLQQQQQQQQRQRQTAPIRNTSQPISDSNNNHNSRKRGRSRSMSDPNEQHHHHQQQQRNVRQRRD